MTTRTIRERRDRLTTIFVAPFMSCSARLPVYVIMISAFIPEKMIWGPFGLQGITLFLMYTVGVLVAIPTAWIMKRFFLKGRSAPFLMELPDYKVPSSRTVGMRVLRSGQAFVVQAGSLILAVSIVVWALAYFPQSKTVAEQFAQDRAMENDRLLAASAQVLLDESFETALEDVAQLADLLNAESLSSDGKMSLEALYLAWQERMEELNHMEGGAQLRQSLLGRMGQAVGPVVEPLGWDWRIGMAALASFPAREIIVATLGVIFNLGDEQDEGSAELRDALRSATHPDGRPLFDVPVALSIMVFFALCAQCAATLAVIRKETGSWLYPVLSFYIYDHGGLCSGHAGVSGRKSPGMVSL